MTLCDKCGASMQNRYINLLYIDHPTIGHMEEGTKDDALLVCPKCSFAKRPNF